MLTADFIVKTRPQDYDWLPTLFRSFERVRGYRRIVLVLEQQYPEPPDMPANAVVARCRQYVGTDFPSNLGVAVERLRSWAYSDADRLIFVDSDCVFSRELDVQSDPSINLDRPIVLWRHWDESGGAAFLRGPARSTLKYDPQRETMVRYPFCFSREVMMSCWFHVGGEERLLSLTTQAQRDSFEQTHAVYALPPTDWNVIGNFAIDCMPEAVTAVHWRDAIPGCVRQFWSHSRMSSPDVQAELMRLGLAG